MRIGCKERDEAQRAEDVSDGKHSLGHQRGVPHFPAVPGFTFTVLSWDRKKCLNGIISAIFKLFFDYTQSYLTLSLTLTSTFA